MGRVYLVLTFVVAASAIRVPVEKEEDANPSADTNVEDKHKPIYYTSDDTNVDSYLVPPDPHKPDDQNDTEAPATQLLPPSPEKQNEYYVPMDTGVQSDWYPIAQGPPIAKPLNILPQRPRVKAGVPIFVASNTEDLKTLEKRVPRVLENDRIIFPLPSRQLEPPLTEPRDFIGTVPSEEQKLPAVNLKHKFKVPAPSLDLELPLIKTNGNYNPLVKKPPVNFHLIPAEPTLALHLTPPKPVSYKNPTKLFPKKYTGGFRPVPIPIAQFSDDTSIEVPKARPLKLLKPTLGSENEYYIPYDDKKIYQFEKAEQQRKLKNEDNTTDFQQQEVEAAIPNYSNGSPDHEQEASETNFGNPGRNSYPAPLRAAPPRAPASNHAPTAAPGERTEFRMHGMNGPHSYQFGYDTGKGKNRQFRFEERDNDGRVRGHYGYMDRSGKLRVVNYNADPEHGFHAESPVEE